MVHRPASDHVVWKISGDMFSILCIHFRKEYFYIETNYNAHPNSNSLSLFSRSQIIPVNKFFFFNGVGHQIFIFVICANELVYIHWLYIDNIIFSSSSVSANKSVFCRILLLFFLFNLLLHIIRLSHNTLYKSLLLLLIVCMWWNLVNNCRPQMTNHRYR